VENNALKFAQILATKGRLCDVIKRPSKLCIEKCRQNDFSWL